MASKPSAQSSLAHNILDDVSGLEHDANENLHKPAHGYRPALSSLNTSVGTARQPMTSTTRGLHVASALVEAPIVYADPIAEARKWLEGFPAPALPTALSGVWLGPVGWLSIWQNPLTFGIKTEELLTLDALEALARVASEAQAQQIAESALRYILSAAISCGISAVALPESCEKAQLLVVRLLSNVLQPLGDRLGVDAAPVMKAALIHQFRVWAHAALLSCGYEPLCGKPLVASAPVVSHGRGCCSLRSARVAPAPVSGGVIEPRALKKLISSGQHASLVAKPSKSDLLCGGFHGTLEALFVVVARGLTRLIDTPIGSITLSLDGIDSLCASLASSLDSGELKKPGQRPGAHDVPSADGTTFKSEVPTLSELCSASSGLTTGLLERWALDPVVKKLHQATSDALMPQRKLQCHVLISLIVTLQHAAGELALADAALLIPSPFRAPVAGEDVTRMRWTCPSMVAAACVAPNVSSAICALLGAAWMGDACAVPPHGAVPASFVYAILDALGFRCGGHARSLSLDEVTACLSPAALAFVLHGDFCADLNQYRGKSSLPADLNISNLLKVKVHRNNLLKELAKELHPQLHHDPASVSETVPSVSNIPGRHADAALSRASSRVFTQVQGGTVRVLSPTFYGSADGAVTERSTVEQGEGHGPRKELFAELGRQLSSNLEPWAPLRVSKLSLLASGARNVMLLELDAATDEHEINQLSQRLPTGRIKFITPRNTESGEPPEYVINVVRRQDKLGLVVGVDADIPDDTIAELASEKSEHFRDETMQVLVRSSTSPLFTLKVDAGMHWPSAAVRTTSFAPVSPVTVKTTGQLQRGPSFIGGSSSATNFADPKNATRYNVAGWMLAAAIINRSSLGLRIPAGVIVQMFADNPNGNPAVLPAGLRAPVSLHLHHLQEADPQLFNSVMDTCMSGPAAFTEVLLVDQSAAQQDPSGRVVLVDQGSLKLSAGYCELPPTHTAARAAFVAKMVSEHLIVQVQPHVRALRGGYRTALGNEGIRKLTSDYCLHPYILSTIIRGEASGVNDLPDSAPGVRVDKMFRIVYDEEFKENGALKDALWQVVNGWRLGKQRKFVQFVTGVSTFPEPGTEVLRIELPFTAFGAKQIAKTAELLPQAHSCTNTLEVPNYMAALKAADDLVARHRTHSQLFADAVSLLSEKMSKALDMTQGYGLDEPAAFHPHSSYRELSNTPVSAFQSVAPGTSTNMSTGAVLISPARASPLAALSAPIAGHTSHKPTASTLTDSSAVRHRGKEDSTFHSDALLGDLLQELNVDLTQPLPSALEPLAES